MRRALATLSLTVTACAAVTGLGDYVIVDDGGAPLSDASSVIDGADARDAARTEAGTDGGSGLVSDAGADGPADTVVDASVRCKATKTCDSKDKSVCCFRLITPSTVEVSCEESPNKCDSNRFPFACDDSSDCASGMICCVESSVSFLTSSSCRTSCESGQTRACRSSAECGGKTCEKGATLDESLPDLRVCR